MTSGSNCTDESVLVMIGWSECLGSYPSVDSIHQYRKWLLEKKAKYSDRGDSNERNGRVGIGRRSDADMQP